MSCFPRFFKFVTLFEHSSLVSDKYTGITSRYFWYSVKICQILLNEILSIFSRYSFDIRPLISGYPCYPDIRCADFQQNVTSWGGFHFKGHWRAHQGGLICFGVRMKQDYTYFYYFSRPMSSHIIHYVSASGSHWCSWGSILKNCQKFGCSHINVSKFKKGCCYWPDMH